MPKAADVILCGAGHNGLVAATLLARAGLDVLVLEARDVTGGAVRTERPFKKAPLLGTSTGAYLLGLVPPELLATLGVELPTIRRDPHWFLPTTGSKYLLFGADARATEAQLRSQFSDADYEAHRAVEAELAAFREDVGQTWLEEPLSIEDTAAKYVRPALRQIFIDLCRKPISAYLSRFGWKSDLLPAMYAVTDAFSGLAGGWDTPGTGMNFLIHNMCRLPQADGTWMIVKGGMGTVARTLEGAARAAGARFRTSTPVQQIVLENGVAKGVVTASGEELSAEVVVVGADPYRLREMVGDELLPPELRRKLDAWKRDGSTLKVNFALKGLPRFTCLPEDRGQYGPTIHLLPDEGSCLQTLRDGHAAMLAGRLPDFPLIEWYIHTTVDPSLKDPDGHHNSALFVEWVPYQPHGSSWDKERDRYVEHLFRIVDRFAPGTSDLVVDTFALAPPDIERHFGMSRGHIHHIDNSFGFADRMPYATGVPGLYACSAGCHPGGSVIGAAGHNAAVRVLEDLGR